MGEIIKRVGRNKAPIGGPFRAQIGKWVDHFGLNGSYRRFDVIVENWFQSRASADKWADEALVQWGDKNRKKG